MNLADLQEAKYYQYPEKTIETESGTATMHKDGSMTVDNSGYKQHLPRHLVQAIWKAGRNDIAVDMEYEVARWDGEYLSFEDEMHSIPSPREFEITSEFDLQEARYHIDHPLVAEIKAAIKSDDWEWRKTFDKLNAEAFTILKGGFGHPIRFDPEDEENYAVATWRINDQKCLNYIFGQRERGTDDIANYVFFLNCQEQPH